MPIVVACQCGKKLSVPEEYAGRRVKCPSCSASLAIPESAAAAALAELDLGEPEYDSIPMPPKQPSAAVKPLPPLSAQAQESKTWEYKVLTQKDKWFSGKFDPERLEQALNAYAKQGWRMRGMASAAFPGMLGGQRDELIFVLER